MPLARHPLTSLAAVTFCATLAAGLVGCESPERGSTGGRIDPYRTTSSDRASQAANIPSLLEFCDITVEDTVTELSDVHARSGLNDRMVLALGGILNKTQHTPTVDFEMIQARLRDKLARSKFVRDHVKFIDDPRATDEEIRRITGTPGAPSATANRTSPEQTYVLQGEFYEAVRGARSQYYLSFKLKNLQQNEIVYQGPPYDLGQLRE